MDASQRCALVHAAQSGHVNVVSFFLQCDWSESYSHPETEDVCGHFATALKQQASQQAFVAAAEAGRTLVRSRLFFNGIRTKTGFILGVPVFT